MVADHRPSPAVAHFRNSRVHHGRLRLSTGVLRGGSREVCVCADAGFSSRRASAGSSMKWPVRPWSCTRCMALKYMALKRGLSRANFHQVTDVDLLPGQQEIAMPIDTPVQRSDPSDGKSGASPSAPGIHPHSAQLPPQLSARIAKRAYELAARRGFTPGHELEDWLQAEREIEAGPPRNTPPDNPFDTVKTFSNE